MPPAAAASLDPQDRSCPVTVTGCAPVRSRRCRRRRRELQACAVPQRRTCLGDKAILERGRGRTINGHRPTHMQIGASERCDPPLLGPPRSGRIQLVETGPHPDRIGERPVEHRFTEPGRQPFPDA